MWALRRCGGAPPIDASLDRLYASFTSAKATRGGRLPPVERIRAYAAAVRERTLTLLERTAFEGPLLERGWVFRFLANHERQHAETMAVGLLLARVPLALACTPARDGTADDGWCEFLPVRGGRYVIGCDDDPDGWDNERKAHEVELAPYAIARKPVTNAAFAAFVESGGYADDRLWSEPGRSWRVQMQAAHPFHWRRADGGWERWTLGGWTPLDPAHPVAHVSWHEAQAFAAWAGARLPTEAEWEAAAGGAGQKRRWPWGDQPDGGADANLALRHGDTSPCGGAAAPCGAEDMAGNVWEWTASPFAPWPGFAPDAYRGYSEPWFGDGHRVLRGGCWITDPAMARTTFRNWFEPHVRTFPSGVRLARDA